MKFVYFKMFSEVLSNRLQVLYMREPAWCDSVFQLSPTHNMIVICGEEFELV